MKKVEINRTLIQGVHEEENDGEKEFRWTKKEFSIKVNNLNERYLTLELASNFNDLSQTVECYINNKPVKKLTLIKGWNKYYVNIGEGDTLILKINKLFPTEKDSRELGARLGKIEATNKLNSPELKITENKILNEKEFLEGKSILKSYPQKLGIDIHGECNFNPPCVFCDYEIFKINEGANVYKPFNEKTLKDYGPFFDNAELMMNCSIGEPLLSDDLTNLLEKFSKEGKILEIATNGSLLGERIRKILLGKKVHLYISLDAARKETYEKLRSKHFEKIIDNIKNLIEERKKFSEYPKIYTVFMPMKTNIHELEDFVKLCADLKIDIMILRPLNDNLIKKANVKRGDYVYNYKDELLNFEELIEVSRKVRNYSKKYNINFYNQLYFDIEYKEILEKSDSEKKQNIEVEKSKIKPPICEEPWKSFYILRGGVLPCCFGNGTIGKMDEFKELWNGEKIRKMREHLARGELSQYCLKSNYCPIVKKTKNLKEQRCNI